MRSFVSDEDKALVEKCIQGNRLAQKELYMRYCDAMFTLAYRITNSFEDADEVLQDTFLGVFTGLHSFKMESTLGAWIKTILVRTAMRKIKKRVSFEEITDQVGGTETSNLGHLKLDAEYLEKAIQSLSDGYRSIFVLIEVEGFSHKEVSEMLDVTVGTSKSQLFHAKKQLQKKLKSMGIDRA
jgi:RNA polymerase sigma-70 factor (ECF subfamily)